MKKILIAMALIALFIGTAAATPYTANLWDADGNGPIGTLQLKPGDCVILSYRMEDVSVFEQGVIVDYTTEVGIFSGPLEASEDDITITTPDNVTLPSGGEMAEGTDIGAITVCLNASAPVGTVYTISIGAGSATAGVRADVVSRYLESIPEFPTIALPVAAILGLAFFMQRRKEE